MARAHAASGVAAGLAVGLFSGDVATTLLCGGIGMLASFVPDLDHPRARVVRALGPLGWLLCRGVRALSRAFGLPAHRGLSHTVLLAVLVGVAAGVTASQWAVALSPWLCGGAASAGVAAALAGDWITKQSLPHLWWPFVAATDGPPAGLRVTTGRGVERWLIFPAVAATAVALVCVALTI